jgi:hypothetical protein
MYWRRAKVAARGGAEWRGSARELGMVLTCGVLKRGSDA